MKKLLSIIMVLVMMASLMACQANTKAATNEESKKPEAAPTQESKRPEDMQTKEAMQPETQEQSPENNATSKFKEENGLLTFLDTEHSPFEEVGIHTIVDKANQSVTFIKTDKTGADSVEYLKFMPGDKKVEKYYYVSMMGTGFFYYYDLEAKEMVRIENDKHEDTTEKAKSSGRFEKPAGEMKVEVEALQKYFAEMFGMSIEDALKK